VKSIVLANFLGVFVLNALLFKFRLTSNV